MQGKFKIGGLAWLGIIILLCLLAISEMGSGTEEIQYEKNFAGSYCYDNETATHQYNILLCTDGGCNTSQIEENVTCLYNCSAHYQDCNTINDQENAIGIMGVAIILILVVVAIKKGLL